MADSGSYDIRAAPKTARLVVQTLLRHGPMTRADVARASGIGRSTVSEVMAELSQAGVVVEAPPSTAPRRRRRGRPGTVMTLRPALGAAVGVDFGYRHVRAVVVDVAHTVLASVERDVPVDYHPQDGLEVAAELVQQAAAEAVLPAERVLGVGASVPGPLEYDSATPTRSMLPGWEDTRIVEELRARTHHQVFGDNDANLGALAESLWGAGQDCADFGYFKLHSGVGGALILDGRLVHGHNGGAGEFGHMALDPRGPVCKCGSRGCLETYAGIPALLHALQPSLGPITFAAFIRMVEAGDPACRRAVTDAAHRVGQAAGILCNVVSPQRLVIGGSLSQMGPPLLEEIQRSLRLSCLPLNAAVEVVAGELGRNASALGAVSLVFSRSWLD